MGTTDVGAAWRRRRARLSPYLLSAVEQALWSLMNVGVGLVLIRLAAPAQYGAYAFWSNCAFVLSSLQNALTVTHLLVLPPEPREARARVERLMFAANLGYLAVVAVVALAATTAFAGSGPIATPAAALFLPAFLLQQFARALAFSRARPAVAAAQTGAVLVVAVAGLALAASLAHPLSADWMLTVLAVAYGVVGVGGLAAARGGWTKLPWRELGAYGGYVRQSAWIFLGVSSSELLARFYAFMVAALYGPASLAALSATQLALRPIPLLGSAWSMAARADFNRRREARDARGFARALVWALALGLVAAAGWTTVVHFGWGALTRHVFGGKYAGERDLVLLWGISAALSFGQVAIGVPLQTLRAFKPLALVNAVASVVAAGAILVALRLSGLPGAIWGTSIGQALEVGLMGLLLASRLRAGNFGPRDA